VTTEAVEALRHEVDAVVRIAEQWTVEQWCAPTRAAGWSSKDMICHLAATFQQLCDPAGVPTDDNLGEQSVDLAVESRRSLLPHEVLGDYLTWSSRALPALESMQAPGTADQLAAMSILGTHPLHLLANAYAFDHRCHVRHDLGQASGDLWPPSADPERLTSAAVEWMIAAAPQMCVDTLADLCGPVDLHIGAAAWRLVSNPGETIELRPVDDNAGDDVDVASPAAAAVIRSSPDAFILWGTNRCAASELDVRISGDPALAHRVIDGFKIY
jgi:hypothetical protein